MPTSTRAAVTPARRSSRPGKPRPAPHDSSLDAPLERILHLLTRLKENRPTTAASLAATWEISRSTAMRDIQYMRDRLGVPLEWDAARCTYVLTGPYDALPLVVLGPRDALTLALAGRVCEVFHGASFASRMDAILKKLAPMLGGAVSVAVDALQHIHTPASAAAMDEFERCLFLLEAIAAHHPVRFTYAKPDAPAPERRLVHPLHLARLADHWRLIAHDPAQGGLRHFLIARIRDVDPVKGTFERPEDFDPAKHLRGTVGAFAGGPEHDVRIALDSEATAYARERPWHASQQLRPRRDGWTEMTLRLSDLPGIRNLVLRWGHHAIVLEPRPLRDDVRTVLASALAHYAGEHGSQEEREQTEQVNESP